MNQGGHGINSRRPPNTKLKLQSPTEFFVLPNAFNSENPHSELKVVFYSSKVKLNI